MIVISRETFSIVIRKIRIKEIVVNEHITRNKQECFDNYLNTQNNMAIVNINNITRLILDEICSFIKPGIKESEVLQYADSVFKRHNIDRIWHKPEVRFGDHTILTYLDRSKKNNILQTEDIVFVDIGIVINGIEGDAGKTLVFGNNNVYKDIAKITEDLFKEARAFWINHHPSGIELYHYLKKRAEEQGYLFNLNPAGHLIGGFSHAAAKWKYGLNQYQNQVESCRWILEVQIKHPTLPVGGFFEDLLV